MKKTLIAMAALAATGAFAQVSVYGRLDAGYANTTITNSATSESKRNGIESHNAMSSLWGVKGSEDLGGGLKATFALEQDVYTATGQLGASGAGNGATDVAQFNRQSNVGLSGGFGSVAIGRNSSVQFGIGASQSYFGTTRLDSVGLANSDGAGSSVGNSVVYNTPSMSGFTAHALYANTDTSSTVSDTKSTITQFAVRYANGPLQAGLGVGNNSSYAGATGVAEATTKGTAWFAAYNFGVAEVRGGMITSKATTAAGAETENKETNVQASVPMGKVTLLAAIGNNTRTTSAGGDSKGSDYTVGVNYNLSKATYLYGRVGTSGKLDASTGISEQKTVGSAVGIVTSF